MSEQGQRPPFGGTPFGSDDFKRKLEAARLRRAKVLAAKGLSPDGQPADEAPTTLQPLPQLGQQAALGNLRAAIANTYAAPAPALEPDPPAAGMPLAPAPLTQPTITQVPAQAPASAPAQAAPPALSVSLVALLLGVAGLGLAFDKDVARQMQEQARTKVASLLNFDGPAGSGTPIAVADRGALIAALPVSALTRAPHSVQPTQIKMPNAQDGLRAHHWTAPSERGRVNLPPLVGGAGAIPQTPGIANEPSLGGLSAVQDTVGAFAPLETVSSTSAQDLLRSVPSTRPKPRAAFVAPSALGDPGIDDSARGTEIEIPARAAPEPPVLLAALAQIPQLKAPVLGDTSVEQLTTPATRTGPRPLARPIVPPVPLRVSKTPLARPEVDLSFPASQLVDLQEGQSGQSADRPLYVHIPSKEDAAQFGDMFAALRNLVTPHVEARPVQFKISEPQIRVYHEQDLAAAAAMAQVLDVRLHDLTSFRPSPKRGLIELWLQGASTKPVVKRASTRRTPRRQPRPAQPAVAPQAVITTPETVETAVEAAAAGVAADVAPQPGTVSATLRQVPANAEVSAPEGTTVRRVQVAPSASRSPMRRLVDSLGGQKRTTIEQFRRENSD